MTAAFHLVRCIFILRFLDYMKQILLAQINSDCAALPDYNGHLDPLVCSSSAAPISFMSFLAYLVGPGAGLSAVGILSSILTHVIVENHRRHQRSADASTTPYHNSKCPNQFASSGQELGRPFQSLGFTSSALDPVFQAWNSLLRVCLDVTSSTAVVAFVCMPSAAYYGLRMGMARIGVKVGNVGSKGLIPSS